MKIFKGVINVILTLIIVVGGIFIALYLFGITPYVVLSGSMEPTIKTGSLSFINKNVKFKDIKEKDIIGFKVGNDTLVTHRVVSKSLNGLTTKGDNNKDLDGGFVTSNNYVGKNIFWIPKIGYAVTAIQTTTGKVVGITSIVLLFLAGILLGEDNKKEKKEKKKKLKEKEEE